ncbi:MAG TPA: type IV-A pilus assembly ATPase PilB [Vicinamibacteria bacterium]|nr:type IV-A pilus assembly ATPase PilB [Vicinamibacteria bacterium]
MPVKLGELLLKENMVTPQQLQEALNHQKMGGGKLGKAFVSLGFVKDEEITSLLSRQYGVPSINLDHFEVDPTIIKIIPAETARKYQVLPLSRSGAVLTIAMADPTNVFAMDDIKFMTGYNVEPVVASEGAIEDAIERYYGSTRSLELRRDTAPAGGGYGMPGGGSIKEAMDGPGLSVDDMAAIGGLSEIDLDSMGEADADVETVKSEDDEIDLGNLTKSADAAPVIKLTNVLLVDSLKRGASDIHIEPYEKEFRVRFRIDGILYNVMALPMKLRDPLISRVKIMAKLDIAEKRLPQDGRIKIKMKVEDRSRDLDFRVSCLPTLWGEKIVMRLLDKSKLMLDMTKLGFEPHSLERFKNAIAKPYGIVLVTGPTGSGKTNTLYSAIAALNKPDTNIMTAEDPVEFNLPGINQVQIRDNIGLNFAAVLRSFLRQDPNIILVGEIRDYETAEIAVKAALTGHLVLSTLHTNDAPSTISRMVNMGIEPFLVGTAVNLIQAQRLVRRVCSKCKVDVSAEVPTKTLVDIGFTPEQIGTFQVFKGKGCGYCNGTGYKGRVGLYEVMEITEGIRDLIMVGATAVEIKRKALEEGMLTLRMSGLEKIKVGVTTVEEVLRETVL